jgi:hypothetical protein
MKNITIIINSVIFLTLFISCTKEDVQPELKADFSVTYLANFDNTIYPSMIFGLTEIEKQEGTPAEYFTITVKPNIPTDIKIIIQESKLNFETVITLYDIDAEKEIIPSVKWKYDELKKLSQPGTVDLTFVCFGDENKEIGRKDIKLSYRAINECVLAAKINNEVVPLYFMVAAYVNEDSPVIDAFLQQVLKYTGLSSFVGYQQGADMVDEQVAAIFYTLWNNGVKYSNITSTSNTNPNVLSQYIRFCSEVLNNTQANCADGTAFFCSVLKKIGIHTKMIFIPGHVYLAYYLDDAKTSLRLLETTMVGDPTAEFIDAINYQVSDYNSHLIQLSNDDYFDQYFTIDIDLARQIIKPIGLK